jgi:hypothetical protein
MMGTPRCADLARQVGLNPAGTAGTGRGFVLVPASGPWPRDPGDLLAGDHRVEDWYRRGLRPQLVAGGFSRREGPPSVLVFERSSGPFAGYRPVDHDERVVIVCCHGARDVCCGSRGTRLVAALEKEPPRSARVLRTSHLGGHRFAPTALVLPEGTMWAFADAELIRGVVDRTLPVARAISHYRGCVGLDTPEAQVADAGALRREGWPWLDEAREGLVVQRREGEAHVEIHAASRSYRARVAVKRGIPVTGCGEAGDPNDDLAPEYELLAITASAPMRH